VITATAFISPPVPTGEYIFLSTFGATDFPYLLILDETGNIVYYQPLPAGQVYINFTQQPNGTLTYFSGVTTPTGGGKGVFHVLDNSYNELGQYAAGNGYMADSHELLLLPNGHALMPIVDEEPKDMTAWGGKPNATFTDLVIQELDQARNVVFNWKASEHIPFTDTYESLTGGVIDPYHGNSIDVLPDGNLLISMRHLSQVVKVNRQTGDVMWRMGGKHSDFTFANDEGFSYQHDVLMHPDATMTVFDNGNQHTPPMSRAVQYQVDEANKTLTRTWEVAHGPGIYGSFMGNVQQLPGGDVFIGWGGPRPIASEVTATGKPVLDLEVGAPGGYVYRWYKLPWTGNPRTAPILAAQTKDITTTLYVSWNGATQVSDYRIEAGTAPNTLAPIRTQPKRGFETSVVLKTDQSAKCYYRVSALDKTGKSLRSSNVVKLKTSSC
jgi:hypothetical protein